MKSIFVICLLMTLIVQAQVISQVAGQAGDQVITSREVQINYFIETALFPDEKLKLPLRLDISSNLYDKEVSRVLIEWVVFREADVFSAAQVPEDDIAKALSVVRSVASSEDIKSYWNRLGATPQELKETINRKLRAKKFVQFKARASVVPVTDAEALQHFQKNKIRFGNAPFAQFKDSIKSFLAQEQANTRIRDWFELLQKKYRVRKVASSGKVNSN